ncbi:hypothetical protein WJX72_011704 [[Myrmecia] bisecta]|uniref:Uncharacterized protein n=1 Tax=[Myrmecia] bisecta TaxID=41462 RepID=A0AAW1PDI9_9CHLO
MSLLQAGCRLHSGSRHSWRLVSASSLRSPSGRSWQQGIVTQEQAHQVQASAPGNPASSHTAVDVPEAAIAAQFEKGAKMCEGCKAVRPLAEFAKLATTADGYHYLCRACFFERQAARYPDKQGVPHPAGPKTCSKCGLTKEGRDFPKDAKAKDGLFYKCRACQAHDKAAYTTT